MTQSDKDGSPLSTNALDAQFLFPGSAHVASGQEIRRPRSPACGAVQGAVGRFRGLSTVLGAGGLWARMCTKVPAGGWENLGPARFGGTWAWFGRVRARTAAPGRPGELSGTSLGVFRAAFGTENRFSESSEEHFPAQDRSPNRFVVVLDC